MDWRKVYYYYLCKIIKKYQRTVRDRPPVKATSIQQPHTMAIFFHCSITEWQTDLLQNDSKLAHAWKADSHLQLKERTNCV